MAPGTLDSCGLGDQFDMIPALSSQYVFCAELKGGSRLRLTCVALYGGVMNPHVTRSPWSKTCVVQLSTDQALSLVSVHLGCSLSTQLNTDHEDHVLPTRFCGHEAAERY